MRLVLVVIIGALGAATTAAGQTGTARDSATVAGHRQLLTALRDTVDEVSVRSAEFRRDLRTVGAETVLARSQRLVTSCGSARAALQNARPALTRLPLEDELRPLRDSLQIAMRDLAGSLQTECLQGLGPEGPGQRADTLRAWGPHRTSNLSQSITLYHGAAARLARRLGIDLSHH